MPQNRRPFRKSLRDTNRNETRSAEFFHDRVSDAIQIARRTSCSLAQASMSEELRRRERSMFRREQKHNIEPAKIIQAQFAGE